MSKLIWTKYKYISFVNDTHAINLKILSNSKKEAIVFDSLMVFIF